MVRITACLVAGVLVGILGPELSPSWVRVAPMCFLLIFTAGFGFRKRKLAGFGGLGLMMVAGYWLVAERTPRHRADHLLNCQDEVISYQVVISSFAEQRTNSIRAFGDILATQSPYGWQPRTGSVLFYIPNRDSIIYRYGDVLLVTGRPQAIPPPANPGAFDFRQYMAQKGIYFQDFISQDRVRLIRNEPRNLFIANAIKIRLWAETIIKSVVEGGREQATAVALVLGVTDGLDNELLQAYASTGALHVLAVSGLHVSIIYWIILIVLKPLDRTRSLKWALAFISVFILWSYAFVSGWSPSVLRAVTMFSFVALARPWRQSTNIFNTLASSMFCLLLYDPYFIMSVGFQLSYLAVFGIVFLQPRLYTVWEPRSRILDELWKVSSVSLAAQVATLPIGLYYFHQFPTYFLPANLTVIPISFVVLTLGLAITAFAFFDPLIQVLGWILTWTIRLMNGAVITFEQLPFSVIDGIHITQQQCFLIAALIASVVMLFVLKEMRWLLGAFVFAIWLSATQWLRYQQTGELVAVRILNVKASSVIDHVADRRSTLLIDSVSAGDDAIRINVLPSWLKDGVQTSESLPAQYIYSGIGWRLWTWNGTSIIQIVNKLHTFPKCEVRFVIISNNSVNSLRELWGVKCEKIIVDSSNSFYFAGRLRNEADGLGVSVWSVLHEGAFEFKHAPR